METGGCNGLATWGWMGMKNKYGKKINQYLILLIVVGLLAIGLTVVAFQLSYSRIYELVLEKDVDQMVLTSRFVTKLVDSDIQNRTGDLQNGAKQFRLLQPGEKERALEQLKILRSDFQFFRLGVADFQGNYLVSNGDSGIIHNSNATLLEKARCGESYISNVVDESDCMIISVPILDTERKPIGVLWGYYRVGSIAANIELNDSSHRYFQIVDDSGQYISDSNNVNSFAQNELIWEELSRYQLQGHTVDSIRQAVEKGESGQFYFTYKGLGRFVYFEPLGIRNWYVFSVLTEEYLMDYVGEIEEIFYRLIWWILISIVTVLVVIGTIIHYTTSFIKQQKEQLEAKNALLFMTLKYTNNVPFQVDLEKQLLSMYLSSPAEEVVTYPLAQCRPEKMLADGLLDPQSYDNYVSVYYNILNLRRMEPVPIRLRIQDKWDVNQIYYEITDQNQVIGCLEDYNAMAEQSEQMNEIRQKSQIDPLTMVYNRENFQILVEERLTELQSRHWGYGALFILDLDYFKQANDTLGHMMGDRILRETALILKTITRDTDICGRLGGDEFVLFIDKVKELSGIRHCAEKITTAMKRVYGNDSKQVAVSASIGVAVTSGEVTFDQLYQRADTALYRAKEKGRGRYEMEEQWNEK